MSEKTEMIKRVAKKFLDMLREDIKNGKVLDPRLIKNYGDNITKH
jgi:hypothetical protein